VRKREEEVGLTGGIDTVGVELCILRIARIGKKPNK
jgi:hypothetical protein